MPVHHSLVVVATLVYLIGKVRVLVSDPDLFLEALLFVVELAKAVLEHLSLKIERNGVRTKAGNYF